jgi:hypothetical protein
VIALAGSSCKQPPRPLRFFCHHILRSPSYCLVVFSSKHSQLVRRITDYSPSTGHAEPGWAVALPFDTACQIGFRYRQDSIYFVSQDILSVIYCDTRRSLAEIGFFALAFTFQPNRQCSAKPSIGLPDDPWS